MWVGCATNAEHLLHGTLLGWGRDTDTRHGALPTMVPREPFASHARPLPNVVFSWRSAFSFPAIDRTNFFAIELEANARAATVLGDEYDAAFLQCGPNASLLIECGATEAGLQLLDGLYIDRGGLGQLLFAPFDEGARCSALSGGNHWSLGWHISPLIDRESSQGTLAEAGAWILAQRASAEHQHQSRCRAASKVALVPPIQHQVRDEHDQPADCEHDGNRLEAGARG